MAQVTSNGGITQTLAQFVAELSYEELSPEAVETIKAEILGVTG